MRRGRLLVITALVIGIGSAALYGTRLSHAPIYLMHDEVNFALQAISIAQSGRDTNGRFLPVYFSEPEFVAGRDPMMIYTTALALTVLPLSDAAVRLPTALVGVFTAVLLLVLWARLSPLGWSPMVAGLLLALSPGWFIHSRLALSVIYPLPFMVAWLIALREYEVRQQNWLLFAAAAALGAGIYGYLAGMLMMPLYVLMTLWFAHAWRSPRALMAIVSGFAIVLVPIAIWHVAYPERVSQLIHGYRLDAPGQGALSPLLSLDGVRERIGAWWQYFDPDFLFLSGDTSLTNSTRAAGLFPAAFAVLLPVGILRLVRGTRFERLILAGLVTGPLAAVATGTIDLNRYRALFVLPFGALVAMYGVEAWWGTGSRWRRIAAIALVATVPVQFAGFYRDYMGRYRDSSGVWFGQNLRAALAIPFERAAPGDPLLISARVPYADSYARFYSQVLGHRATAQSPVLVDGDTVDFDAVDARSWLIAGAGEAWVSRLSRRWMRVAEITEPSGAPSFLVYRRIS